MTTIANDAETEDAADLAAPPLTTTNQPGAGPAKNMGGGNSAYHPMLVTVELSKILPSSLNRDTTLSETELAELVASFGDGPKPRLAQLPTGELQPGPGGFIRLIDGARRITALKACAKWDMVEMLVSPAGQLTAEEKLNLRTLAIWHRKDHSPFERAADLKLGYLTANAYRLGAGFDVEKLLGEAEDAGRQLALVVREVEQLLEALPEWSATRPAISWKAHLDSLGIEMQPTARRNLLKLLDVRPDLQELIGELPVTISEVGLRGLARLGEADQAQLVAALQRDPYKLADQLASMTDKIRLEGWSVEQALTHYLALAESTPSNVDNDPPLGDEEEEEGYKAANRSSHRDHATTTSAGGNAGSSNQSSRRASNGYDRDSRGDGFEDMAWSGGGAGSGGSYGSGYGGGADFEDGFEVEGLPKEIPPGLAERLDALAEDGVLKLSDTARRSLAGLPPDDQERVINRLIDEPKLTGKLPSIVKIMRDEGWSLDAAIREVLATTGKGGGAANKAAKSKSGTGEGMAAVVNSASTTGKSKAELEQAFSQVQALTEPSPATPQEKLEVGTTALVQLADQLSQALALLKEALGEVTAGEGETPTEHDRAGRVSLPPQLSQTITEALAAITTLAGGFTTGPESAISSQVTSEHLAA